MRYLLPLVLLLGGCALFPTDDHRVRWRTELAAIHASMTYHGDPAAAGVVGECLTRYDALEPLPAE